MMLVKEMNIDELSAKVLEGAKKAIRKLVEETAAKDGELIVRGDDGTVKSVPAKDLLPLVQK